MFRGEYQLQPVLASDVRGVVGCSPAAPLAFSDYDADPADGSADARGEFAELTNAGDLTVALEGCTFAVFDPYAEEVTYAAPAAGLVDPGATYSFANVALARGQTIPAGTLDDGPGVFVLFDGEVADGQDVAEAVSAASVVAAVVYYDDDEVFGQVGGGGTAAVNAQAFVEALARLFSVATEGEGVVDLGVAVAPNPVAGTGTVTFGLAEGGDARVSLYDALGREVAVLAEGPRGSGRHTVGLSASALPAGVYVVRVVTAGEAHTARLTVVK